MTTKRKTDAALHGAAAPSEVTLGDVLAALKIKRQKNCGPLPARPTDEMIVVAFF